MTIYKWHTADVEFFHNRWNSIIEEQPVMGGEGGGVTQKS